MDLFGEKSCGSYSQQSLDETSFPKSESDSESEETLSDRFFRFYNEELKETDIYQKAFLKTYIIDCLCSHISKTRSSAFYDVFLEEALKKRAEYIDDRDGVNNFAAIALSLTNGVEIENISHTWESGLDSLNPEDLLPPVNEENIEYTIPTPEEVVKLFSIIDGRSTLTDSNVFLKSGSRKSIFATYEKPGISSVSEAEIPCKNVSQKKDFNNQMIASNNVPATSDRIERFDAKLKDPPSKQKYSWDQTKLKNRFKRNEKIQSDQDSEDEEGPSGFTTASHKLTLNQKAKRFGSGQEQRRSSPRKKSLGGKGCAVSKKFVPPLRGSQEEEMERKVTSTVMGRGGAEAQDLCEDPRLDHIEPRMVELIMSEIMDSGPSLTWDDIAGLDFPKQIIQEIVVWPMLRPDIFTGLRRPPKGILLFGPPGTGKTLIGKCIASQSKSTFFSISASSLTSKWIGDGEKMVRALFAVARVQQPAVVFIDEIDSLLSQRSDQEHESSRRIKTEFLVQLDGAATGEEDRLLIVGATNRPQELDEAARRRLVRRLYIPLPDSEARKQLVGNLMKKESNSLTEEEMEEIASLTEGYSGADMKNVCQEACLGPIRSLTREQMCHISPDQVRPVDFGDFKGALLRVKSSVASKDLEFYLKWDRQFGMSSTQV